MRFTRLGLLGTFLALVSLLPWGIPVIGIIFPSLLPSSRVVLGRQDSPGQDLHLPDKLLLSPPQGRSSCARHCWHTGFVPVSGRPIQPGFRLSEPHGGLGFLAPFFHSRLISCDTRWRLGRSCNKARLPGVCRRAAPSPARRLPLRRREMIEGWRRCCGETKRELGPPRLGFGGLAR